MSQDLQACDWRVIRVLRVMPTLDLINRELREELTNLYASTGLSFDPPILDGAADIHPTWDDTPHALKTMLKVRVWSTQYVDSLSTVFADGCQSNPCGARDIERRFDLRNGEYISDVMVWDNTVGVCAVQFITTNGRLSPHFGGSNGTPKILSSEAGVLAGFIGRIAKRNDKDMVGRIQAIWRHDIPQALSIPGGRHAVYIGGDGGLPFNDWPFNISPYISRVDLRCESSINGIQMSYSQKRNGGTITSQAPYHGGPGGAKQCFELGPDEHIVAVSGIQASVIVRLCFVTNEGRTSDAYGGDGREEFICQPQTIEGNSTRLAFIAGKCARLLVGLLLIWAPI
ncbi:hypothetical protein FRC07_002298 [Ceratobasidium sp. 392]|nr:hypothetical protein FRC07_002298 [Ceratobasidium sp. 392]